MKTQSFDVVFVGGGPGGYTGAIRAAQLGQKVALVDENTQLGGTCLRVGCIPSKALLDSSKHFEFVKDKKAREHGIEVSGLKLNLKGMMQRKTRIVTELSRGIAFLIKKNKITLFAGRGRLCPQKAGGVSVAVEGKSESMLQARAVVLATGSVPVALPFAPYDGERVLSSTEALSLKKVPSRLIVIGAGVIGLELGSVWRRLGAQVTVIEAFGRIGGVMDSEVSRSLRKILEKQGMEFLLKSKVLGIKKVSNGVQVNLENKETVCGEAVLVAVGRRPQTEGLGLEKVGVVTTDRGQIQVNSSFETTIPGVYAIGDVIEGPMLAHKAEEEGVAVAEIVSGQRAFVNHAVVPSVVYTWPEVASVGQTEEQLKEQRVKYKKGVFPFIANGRATTLGETQGFVKILSDAGTDRILGCHILGPEASEILSEVVMAMEFSGTSQDVGLGFHAHPTLSEAIREAALSVTGLARQI